MCGYLVRHCVSALASFLTFTILELGDAPEHHMVSCDVSGVDQILSWSFIKVVQAIYSFTL